MTDVSQIDILRTAQAVAPQRQPARDFREELAHDRRSQDARSRSVQAVTLAATSDEDASPTALQNGLSPAWSSVSVANIETSATLRLLQQMAVQPVGDLGALRNARVFGVHLLADAYLSEVGTRDDHGGAEHALCATTAGADASAWASSAGDDASTSPAAAADKSDFDAQAFVAQGTTGIVAMASPSRGDVTLDGVVHGMAGAGTLANWVDRLLRYSRQPDGSVVAWLRDFRLGEGQVPALVATVLQHANQLGMTPGRIMLNGQLVWPSTHTTQGEQG